MEAQAPEISLVSLLYMSKATDAMEADQLSGIERTATARNREANVSGLLIYNGTNFVQLLEGEEGMVSATMDRIRQDPRHTNIHVLRHSGVRERECPDWAMRCQMLEMTEDGAAERFAASLPPAMLPDTRLIFTSLASAVGRERPVQA